MWWEQSTHDTVIGKLGADRRAGVALLALIATTVISVSGWVVSLGKMTQQMADQSKAITEMSSDLQQVKVDVNNTRDRVSRIEGYQESISRTIGGMASSSATNQAHP